MWSWSYKRNGIAVQLKVFPGHTCEEALLSLDDGSPSDYTFFGTPEGARSGVSPVGSAFDEGASSREAYEGPSGPVPLLEQFGEDADSGKPFRSLVSRAAEWSAASTSCCLSLVHFDEVGAFAPLVGARLMLSCRAGVPVFLRFCAIASQSRFVWALGSQCLRAQIGGHRQGVEFALDTEYAVFAAKFCPCSHAGC